MDYSKSGGARPGKNSPRYAEHNAKGSTKNPFGDQTKKAELLARMKAAAATGTEAKKED
ncbi:MAG: hypothetical protein PHX82_15775 [Paracoccaceae bacterium]|nr:hypothetical protein [Paracoccaceae bacterium]